MDRKTRSTPSYDLDIANLPSDIRMTNTLEEINTIVTKN